MCTPGQSTETTNLPALVGVACPLCGEPSQLTAMKFSDPHGLYRVDPSLYECAAGRHTFVVSPETVQLLSADGVLVRPRRNFRVTGTALAEK